ncbi:3-isopropylmalate dehydratase small subunit [Rhizobium sp. NPDC090275]|uniref:3-isopropylmalate dehydratase small subunit n=1 Tax=Rhizobium sp. NPDC090275 TaxID=3364498 RepID=UPI00383B1975
MKPFERIDSVAAWLNEDEVDTDIIFPARFLLLLDKTGLGKHAFHERRNARSGAPFVLDTPPFTEAEIFVGGKTFGTGSSREQAVWAMADFGIRCVIAPSFGEIFFANCFKNGVLPVIKTGADLEAIQAAAAAGKRFSIDLAAQTIAIGNELTLTFEVDAFRKQALLKGLDEIGAILAEDVDDISAFEAQQRRTSPWLYLAKKQLEFFDDLDKGTSIG